MPTINSQLPEETLRYLEEHIPELADAAARQAYWQTLASGDSVLEAANGSLVEVFSDGTRKVIRELPPQTSVTAGQRLESK